MYTEVVSLFSNKGKEELLVEYGKHKVKVIYCSNSNQQKICVANNQLKKLAQTVALHPQIICETVVN